MTEDMKGVFITKPRKHNDGSGCNMVLALIILILLIAGLTLIGVPVIEHIFGLSCIWYVI